MLHLVKALVPSGLTMLTVLELSSDSLTVPLTQLVAITVNIMKMLELHVSAALLVRMENLQHNCNFSTLSDKNFICKYM